MASQGSPTPSPEGQALLDRVLRSGCQRVAILGLHARAGTLTVLSTLVREVHRRSWPLAVTSAPRLPIESETDPGTSTFTRIALPEGSYVATAVAGTGDAGLEEIESAGLDTPAGPVAIYRVARGGEVDLHGPDDSEGMERVLRRLGTLSGGLVFVDGAWERRAFAAPGVTEGIILALGAGYSATPERSAAAARYVVEMLTVPPCDEPARLAWDETAAYGAAALLDGKGKKVGVLPPGLADPVPALRGPDGTPISTVVLPYGLNDEFMIPLVRSQLRCVLVVRDATRINIAPIYFKAWLKGGGTIQSVRPARLIAVSTNPVNPAGPDADPARFRKSVAEALPELPVHDVVLESGEQPRKPIWKFWE